MYEVHEVTQSGLWYLSIQLLDSPIRDRKHFLARHGFLDYLICIW